MQGLILVVVLVMVIIVGEVGFVIMVKLVVMVVMVILVIKQIMIMKEAPLMAIILALTPIQLFSQPKTPSNHSSSLYKKSRKNTKPILTIK